MTLFSKLILFFIPAVIFAGNIKKHEKTKTISKKFEVSPRATVYIDNKYGNLTVTTWDKNTVEIDVKIVVKGKDLDDVESKLNAISIDFEANKNLVEARTNIENTRSGWSWWKGSSKLSYKINYYIKMPMTNNADLNNKYGSIDLESLKGSCNIECSYGSIQVDELSGNNNSIDLGYCGSSTINYLKTGNLNVDYSKITVEKTESIRVNADYTGVKIGKADKVDFNCDYGSITINEATIVYGKSDYAGMRIGTLKQKLDVNTDYGGLRIKNLEDGFESVIVDGSYAGIKIGTSDRNSFDFVMDLSYASFSYPEEYVETYKSIKKSTKKYYEGKFGKGVSDSKIRVKSDYGGISIKINE